MRRLDPLRRTLCPRLSPLPRIHSRTVILPPSREPLLPRAPDRSLRIKVPTANERASRVRIEAAKARKRERATTPVPTPHEAEVLERPPEEEKSPSFRTLEILVGRGIYPRMFVYAEEEFKAGRLKATVEVYELLINACASYANGSLVDLAFRLRDEMLEIGLKPSEKVDGALGRVLRKSPDFLRRIEWLEGMKGTWKRVAWEYVADGWLTDGALEMAMKTLDDAKLDYTWEIGAALKEIGEVEAALKVFAQVEERGYRVDEREWWGLLVRAAEELNAEVVEQVWWEYIHELPGDGVCEMVLRTAARHGLSALAEDCCRAMRKRGTILREWHWAGLIEAYARDGSGSTHDEEITSVIADSPFWSTLHDPIDAPARVALNPPPIERTPKVLHSGPYWIGVFHCLNNMRALGAAPSKTTTAAIIPMLAFTPVANIASAFDALVSSYALGNNVDIAAIDLILAAFCTTEPGNFDAAFQVYLRIPDFGLRPTTSTFNHLLGLCAVLQKRDAAMALAGDMKDARAPPDQETYANLIDVSTFEEAFLYLEEMKEAGFKVNLRVYDSLLVRCWSEEEGEDPRFERVLDEVAEMGLATGDVRRWWVERLRQKRVKTLFKGEARLRVVGGEVEVVSEEELRMEEALRLMREEEKRSEEEKVGGEVVKDEGIAVKDVVVVEDAVKDVVVVKDVVKEAVEKEVEVTEEEAPPEAAKEEKKIPKSAAPDESKVATPEAEALAPAAAADEKVADKLTEKEAPLEASKEEKETIEQEVVEKELLANVAGVEMVKEGVKDAAQEMARNEAAGDEMFEEEGPLEASKEGGETPTNAAPEEKAVSEETETPAPAAAADEKVADEVPEEVVPLEASKEKKETPKSAAPDESKVAIPEGTERPAPAAAADEKVADEMLEEEAPPEAAKEEKETIEQEVLEKEVLANVAGVETVTEGVKDAVQEMARNEAAGDEMTEEAAPLEASKEEKETPEGAAPDESKVAIPEKTEGPAPAAAADEKEEPAKARPAPATSEPESKPDKPAEAKAEAGTD